MNKLYTTLLLFHIFTGALLAQTTTLYQERFPNGKPELIWVPGDGISQVRTATRSNPSGDNTVGYVAGAPAFGNTGQILAGLSTLKNYKVEAQVFIVRAASAGSGTNNGILARIIPLGQTFKGYVFASDFDSNNRLRLRKFTGAAAGTPPVVVRDWTAAEIPGGLPTTSSWHKLALDFQGNQINAFYDDQLLPGSPFTDATADSGYFGVYGFVGFDTAADSATFFDDVKVSGLTTAIDTRPAGIAPTAFQLLQNYPNPFNPATTIPFTLESASEIQLEILNLAGQKIATVVNGRWPEGEHRVDWNAAGVPSGVYLVRLKAAGQTLTKRTLLVK